MEVVKFVGVGIIICVLAVIIKQVKPEFTIFVVIGGGILLLLTILNHFTTIFSTFYQIMQKTSINSELFGVLMKIIGVGYLVEFGASLCDDSGNSSIGDKIILGGKIMIFVMAIPIISSLFNIILEIIP